MSAPADLVTVYRSMDATAKEDCQVIAELLSSEGLAPTILDDSAAGVPKGVFEVQVPSAQSKKAEKLIADNPLPDEAQEVDDSADLDLETIYHGDGTLAEVESLEVKNVLEASGIAAVLVGNSVLPTMSFEVRVARDQADRARELLREAVAAGPKAAEEAEALFEAQSAANPNKQTP